MQLLTTTLAAFAACASPSSSATATGPVVNGPAATRPAPAKDTLSPPGLVLVPGGRTKVGTDFDDMKELIEEHTEAQELAAGFLSEVPQHTVTVDDFFCAVTEVTNEQYRQFVLATGAQPPLKWGAPALDVARQTFLEEEAEKRRAAKEAGERVPERKKFDEFYWWERNWEGAEWEMPEELAKQPVVFVDYQDARAYAEWAGLRLLSEFEWERAVRANTENNFTWGEEWETGKCVTKELRATSDIVEAGRYPGGASPLGLQDLHGNVWEWTSSRYVEYPKWKHQSFKVGKGRLVKEIDRRPKFSPDRRVTRGGSQQNSWIFARASTRGGFDRQQKASHLGFRVGGSVKQGLDFANIALDAIPNAIRPQDSKGPVEFDSNQVIARDRWISSNAGSDVPDYEVIERYDYVLYTPVKSLQVNGLGDIRKGSQTDEIYHLGVLVTNQDLVEPAIRAGTYMIALRGAGKYPPRKEEGEEEVVVEGEEAAAEPEQTTLRVDEFLEIDTSVDNYLFIDMSGTPVAAMPATDLDYGNPKAGMGTANVVDRTVMIEVSANDPKDPEATEEIEVQQQWLEVSFFIKGRSRKGLKAMLGLRFAEGLLDSTWR